MKKLSFWAWGFIIAGVVLLMGSSVWFGKFSNPSEYFLYLGASIFLFAFAGFCELSKGLIRKQDKLKADQLEIQRWITEQEREKEK